MKQEMLKPDYLFEVSWEICNKVGGINTVIATKALSMKAEFQDHFITIGPDLWREAQENPTFQEDPDMFRNWRQKAAQEGLKVKAGRWKIPGSPIVFLVDFSPFISMKNEIFASFWETYKLDSISGQRDYVEAATFGYASGMVIESFYNFYLTYGERVIAHFHEWMTGAGILYLKIKAPQIATIFTTHATAVGRSIAGNGQPLYEKLSEYNGDTKARELGVVAKQSMEKKSAQASDCFTTVSEITARECEQFLERPVDVVTPNGFEDNFVPPREEFELKRERARMILRNVAESVLGYEVSDDAMYIANSGRYEFRNKGIDIFIHSLAALNQDSNLKREVVAFILVPANNYGPRRDVQERIKDKDKPIETGFLTHGLHDSEWDQILNEIKNTGLKNDAGGKVRIIYAPCYLNGDDGIFNTSYYDLLIGMDLTVFPSYYEPWGYTPLESLAFHVPTITTNLAGIGMWVNKELVSVNEGIEVFERGVGIDQGLIKSIVDKIISYTERSEYDKQRAHENAFAISRIALWKNLVKYYFIAYSIALDKVKNRVAEVGQTSQTEIIITQRFYKSNKPIWKRAVVQSHLPDALQGLDELSKNLWWCWNHEAEALFEYISPELWELSERNPVLLLKEVSYERFVELVKDAIFIERYRSVYKSFFDYMSARSHARKPSIAYFSMEFGLQNNLKIYSGGLGILAGDYLKQASDSNIDMVGVGFLYKYGYFTQKISLTGEQLVSYEPLDFDRLPVTLMTDADGQMILITVAFPGRNVLARVWKVDVGRVPLYLLDTDFDPNNAEDRKISHQLYGGDEEHRLKQEMVLGIGGIRALKQLCIDKEIYHCNEGHAALLGLERINRLINERNLTFAESLEIVRASTLFTTHTPVPAGHDAFSEDLVMIYMGHYPNRLRISWEEFINLGRVVPNDKNEKFSMSVLAANVAQEMNGVSMLHGEVTKNMFNNLWDGYYPQELYIGYVTNGVHVNTWMATEWKKLYESEFGAKYVEMFEETDNWGRIYKLPNEKVWETRQLLRKKLIDYITARIDSNWVKQHEDPKKIVEIKAKLNKNALTIGFARRFATYKRAHLFFRNLDRLDRIVNNPDYPVQILFAGKAHPRDGAGQGLIKQIVEISKMPRFLGKILFLEGYDMELAKKLVQGVDIWLNTPTRPLEASGTSGMKAVMNGVMNLSVLDGWWVEGYREDAGWALPLERTYENQAYQDELDAEMLYGLIEHEIVPLFYKRDEKGLPAGWVERIKNCIANIAPEFSTKRMIDDYISRYYDRMGARYANICKDNYSLAMRIASWKKKVHRGWDNIEVVSTTFPDTNTQELVLGEKYVSEIVLNLHELADIDVGIEILFSETQTEITQKFDEVKELELIKKEGPLAFYRLEFYPRKPGVINYGLRIFPKNPDLPHRQDFAYLKWI